MPPKLHVVPAATSHTGYGVEFFDLDASLNEYSYWWENLSIVAREQALVDASVALELELSDGRRVQPEKVRHATTFLMLAHQSLDDNTDDDIILAAAMRGMTRLLSDYLHCDPCFYHRQIMSVLADVAPAQLLASMRTFLPAEFLQNLALSESTSVVSMVQVIPDSPQVNDVIAMPESDMRVEPGVDEADLGEAIELLMLSEEELDEADMFWAHETVSRAVAWQSMALIGIPSPTLLHYIEAELQTCDHGRGSFDGIAPDSIYGLVDTTRLRYKVICHLARENNATTDEDYFALCAAIGFVLFGDALPDTTVWAELSDERRARIVTAAELLVSTNVGGLLPSVTETYKAPFAMVGLSDFEALIGLTLEPVVLARPHVVRDDQDRELVAAPRRTTSFLIPPHVWNSLNKLLGPWDDSTPFTPAQQREAARQQAVQRLVARLKQLERVEHLRAPFEASIDKWCDLHPGVASQLRQAITVNDQGA